MTLSRFLNKNGGYVAAVMITVGSWAPVLFHPGFIMHADLAYNTTLENLKADFYPIWNQHPSMSNFDEIDRLLIIEPLLWIAQLLHIGVGPFSRLFPFLVSLCGSLGIVYSVRVLRSTLLGLEGPPNLAVEILAVVIFSLNPWALFRVQAPYYQMAYNFAPPFIALQLRYLFTGAMRYAAAAIVCWTLASGSPQYTIFSALMSLVFLAMVHQCAGAPSWGRLLSRYVAILAGYGILNLYWIGAFFEINSVSQLTPGYTLRWEDVVGFSQNSTFFNVISGLDVWVVWWQALNPFASGPFDTIANVLRPSTFCFAIGLALLNWRRHFFVYAFLIILGLVLLLQGAHGPIAPMYKFMVFHVVPGYGWIIRAPEKFGAFLWIFYAWTIALGADRLSLARPRLVTALACGAAIVTGVAFFPVIYSTLLFHYVPVEIPQAYLQMSNELENKPGKVLLIADYEKLGQWNSGEAIFTWASQNMAGSVTPKSFPLPTFAVYHFTNPFTYFYSFIKFAGPQYTRTLASVVGTRYIALEHDVIGDEAWYREWRQALIRQHAKLLLENADFAIFEFPGIAPSEVRSGPYAVLAGDLNAVLSLAHRFGTGLSTRNLFFLDQALPEDAEDLIRRASLLILDHRTLTDLAAYSLMGRYGVTYPSSTGGTTYQQSWAAERLAYRFESGGGFWDVMRRATNSQRWVLDSERGVLATNASGAALPLRLSGRAQWPAELYVRMYAPMPRAASAFHVVTPSGTFYQEAHVASPKWTWYKVAGFDAGAPLGAQIVNDYGLSIFGGAILVPRGTLVRRRLELQRAFAGRIFTAGSVDPRRWPPARTLATVLPGSAQTFEASHSLLLNESYDPLWICASGKRTMQSVPAWAFENACAPIDGPVQLYYVEQTAVVKWLLIEAVVLIVLIPLLVLFERSRRRTVEP
ncbi:MAG TPA: hypothetical protein VGG89_13210 [Candidatus Baltobacteraceae bacterium]|jgi:hypothetical protein